MDNGLVTPRRRAAAFIVMTTAGLIAMHAYWLLVGVGSVNVWPLLVAAVALLVIASGWVAIPISRVGFTEAGRHLGWSGKTSEGVWRAVCIVTVALFISVGTILL